MIVDDRFWWVRGSFFCGLVVTENDLIVDTMPILTKFIGQPVANLERWRHYIERREIGA